MENFFNSSEGGSNGGESNEEMIEVWDTKSTVSKIIENSWDQEEVPKAVKCLKCWWWHEPGRPCLCY